MRTLWLGLRSALFYLGYILLTTWFSLTGVLFCSWLPYRIRTPYLAQWNRLVLWWLRLTCGVRFVVEGRDNIPTQWPFVVLAKHQSQWETFFLQLLFHPVVTTVKRELLAIPGFGWGLRLMNPIAINRGSPKESLKQVMRDGQQRLSDGFAVMIFPEGTRTPPGQASRYARSGAELAVNAGVPIVPVAHNAGECWPAHGFLKYPGLITISIGQPIPTTDRDSRSLIQDVQQWIEAEVARASARNRGAKAQSDSAA